MALKWLYTIRITFIFLATNGIFAASIFISCSFALSLIHSFCCCCFFYWYYKVHINLMRVLLVLFDRYFVKYKCAPKYYNRFCSFSVPPIVYVCKCINRLSIFQSNENGIVTGCCNSLAHTHSNTHCVCMCSFFILQTTKWKFFLLPWNCSHTSDRY